MKNQPKGVPPVTPKSIRCEKLERGQSATVGTDGMSKYSGNYSKVQPKKEEDTFFTENY